jgi:hypothetical protein
VFTAAADAGIKRASICGGNPVLIVVTAQPVWTDMFSACRLCNHSQL